MTALSLQQQLLERPPALLVIGASAGGIDALRVLFAALRPGLGLAILVVLHIGPGAKGEWQVVFPGCPLPILEAEDKLPAQPGHVYFAPPDYHLLVDGTGRLGLSLEAPVNQCRPAVDVLFQSAAWSYGKRLLAIVLSGANSDGAQGLRAVADAGGSCWVQDPLTAMAASMPRAAVKAVPEAAVETLEEMAAALASLEPVRAHA
jgi:two-component system chemotaxis response regulator CheB